MRRLNFFGETSQHDFLAPHIMYKMSHMLKMKCCKDKAKLAERHIGRHLSSVERPHNKCETPQIEDIEDKSLWRK